SDVCSSDLLQIRDARLFGGLRMVGTVKAFQPELVVPPVSHDVIVLVEHFTVPFPERFRFPGILVLVDDAVRAGFLMNHLSVPPIERAHRCPVPPAGRRPPKPAAAWRGRNSGRAGRLPHAGSPFSGLPP